MSFSSFFFGISIAKSSLFSYGFFFFYSSLGPNPRYIGRSFLEARDLIRAGARLSVGAGLTVDILKDPWLHSSDCPYIQSTHTALTNQKVACLMKMNSRA